MVEVVSYPPPDGGDRSASTRSVSPSPSSSSSSSSDAERVVRSICMSLLLNPSDEDNEDLPEPEAAVEELQLQPVKVPKKRGRKPILPKMNNSERGKYYRAKRKAYSGNLVDEISILRSSVARLAALRGICNELAVCPRNTPVGSLVKLVREYFVQFRHGVQLPPNRRDLTLPDVQVSSEQQALFMNATMVPDLAFGEFKGIGVVMDQWERYSKFHSFLHFELLEVSVTENATGHIVETVGQLRTRYSRRTIENVFPHVIGNEELIQRLIGTEVVYPCRNQFYFTADGRVQRYNVEADFPEALQKAIGRLDDVALLLGNALIEQQHMMGELDGEEAAIVEQLGQRSNVTAIDDSSVTMDVEYVF